MPRAVDIEPHDPVAATQTPENGLRGELPDLARAATQSLETRVDHSPFADTGAIGPAALTRSREPGKAGWGDALGLGGIDQQDMFQRAMSRLFGGAAITPALTIGRFTILRTLGEGGMGVVYAAYDGELDRKVAIKLVNDHAAGVEGKARLLREAQAMAGLAHPNIAAIYDVGLHGEQIYVAMEYIKGQTLQAWSDAHRGSWKKIVAMFCAAGEGLDAAHCAGLIHRDFKPDNVLVGDYMELL